MLGTIFATAEASVVEDLDERFSLVVDEPQRWSTSDLESLLRGAEALPSSFWDAVEGPVTLSYVERPCLFSMGRYNDRCPTFDGPQRFFIYDEATLAGEGAVQYLERLTGSEQRDLLLRRAVVHLVMVHVDQKHQWSGERRWQAVNGWLDDDERPLNRHPKGYSRYLGMQSAHLDLVTFAEEYFVPPEEVLRDRIDDDGVDERLAMWREAGDGLECREFTRHRIFHDFVTTLQPQWSKGGRDDTEEECSAFEEWAMLDRLESVELWFAAGRNSRPESLFGHLLLQLRYGDGDEIYQVDVIDDDDAELVQYYMRRALGGFTSELTGVDDDSDLGPVRRYELHLDDEQSRQLLQRLWEAERKVRFPYHFAAKNGAAFLAQILEPALDQPVSLQGSTLVMATDVLDGLAAAESSSGEAIIELNSSEQAFGQRVLGPSGRHRMHLGGGWSPEDDRWTGRISYARLAEELGEPRLRGVRPDVGVRVFEIDASIPVNSREFQEMSWDLTVFRYESLERPQRADSTGLRGRLGWRLDARILHDGRRDMWAGAEVTPSVLMPLVANSDLSRHLLVALGPALRYDVHRGHDFYGGAAAGLYGRLHLYGSYANALRFGVQSGQYTGFPLGLHYDVRGSAELRHRIASRGEYRWIAAPYLEGMWTTRRYGEDSTDETFEHWEAGLRLEMPF